MLASIKRYFLVMLLKEKTIIIFGGTGGIGSAVVSGCFEQGANIVIVGRDLDKLAKTKENLNNSKRVIAISASAENKREVEKVFNEALEAFGCIDGVFISIGSWEQNFPTDSEKSLADSKERLLPGLVSAVQNIGNEALKYFGERGGVIFHVSSQVVHKGENELPGNHIYRELKTLAEKVLDEIQNKNPRIKVVHLRPSIVKTPKNEKVLTKNGDFRDKAVQPEVIASWVIANFNNPAEKIVKFESEIIV